MQPSLHLAPFSTRWTTVRIQKEVSMHRMACSARSRAFQVALSVLCGLTLAPFAYSQTPGPDFTFPSSVPASTAAADQQQQSAGTVLTVPLSDYGTIVAQNAMRQKNVNLLHLTQVVVGDVNTQVATISIRQKNRQDARKWEASKECYLPVRSLGWIKQANKNTAIIEQSAFGWGNQQVAQVEVYQDNEIKVKKGTRFLVAPRWAAEPILALNQKNVNVVHLTQLVAGDENSQVAVIAVDQKNARSVKVPAASAGALVQLNLNLTIINQVAVGNGNTQVATVSVGQDNKL
jgi:hypothetical protein